MTGLEEGVSLESSLNDVAFGGRFDPLWKELSDGSSSDSGVDCKFPPTLNRTLIASLSSYRMMMPAARISFNSCVTSKFRSMKLLEKQSKILILYCYST